MLLSLSIILLFGFLAGEFCKKLRLPSLIGMLAVGIAIGPYALNLLDAKTLGISAELRKIALIIILSRAGLSLNVSALKKVARPAVLMCLVLTVAVLAIIITAPLGAFLIDISYKRLLNKSVFDRSKE